MAEDLNYAELINWAAAGFNLFKGFEHAQEVFRAVLQAEQRLAALQKQLAEIRLTAKAQQEAFETDKAVVTTEAQNLVDRAKKTAADLTAKASARVKKLEAQAKKLEDLIAELDLKYQKAEKDHSGRVEVLETRTSEAEAKLKATQAALATLKSKLED